MEVKHSSVAHIHMCLLVQRLQRQEIINSKTLQKQGRRKKKREIEMKRETWAQVCPHLISSLNLIN